MKKSDSITLLIQNTVLSQIKHKDSLLIAYSGGIDSSVLLHVLVMLKQQALPNLCLTAIYIHHGISQYADDWAKHCQLQCQQWQVPCLVEKVRVNINKGNIEQQARDLRYQAIAKHLTADISLCTAQHLDDQAETFLLALKRGSGPAGLSSMPTIMKFEHSTLLRPLLSISRADIEAYASENGLTWIEDESNQDDHYDRNFLRLNVLPLFNQRWPHFNQMVARSAELCQEQQQLLNDLLIDSFNQLIDEQQRLSLLTHQLDSPAKRNALLRMWFKIHQINMPTRKQLDVIWQTVIQAKDDSNPQFILNNKQIRRYKNQLYLLPLYQDISNITLAWDGTMSLILPDQLGSLSLTTQQANCRAPLANEQITIAFNTQGHFYIIGRNHSRQLKKLWQEFNIAPWMRTRIPLVFYNQTLISAVGVFVTKAGQGDQISFNWQK